MKKFGFADCSEARMREAKLRVKNFFLFEPKKSKTREFESFYAKNSWFLTRSFASRILASLQSANQRLQNSKFEFRSDFDRKFNEFCWTYSSESLEKVFFSALNASGVMTSLTAAKKLDEVFGLQVQKLVKIDASESVFLESSLLFDLNFRHCDLFCPFKVWK